ncbi:methylated-DNA--[protein]-cysteine S-methyltransferase [Streptomyces coffeae]|uniref:Methylated-DNA--protein-cysteine methyltransferase n=1 Tax=Streptomyces coffeae TaxID=621382 RepID=A0ABS1NC33_9ACTN|nr:methylated-DNA--[protein]-cysteine S-methyltransferase [Streptomyces coffeae]MBL1097608.1 methylated-DNA--[protein]-cysteine S-methyltransferase [Streptomyces coffeae]
MTIYTLFDSPLGELLLAGEKSATAPGGVALTSLSVPEQRGGATVGDDWRRDDAAFTTIVEQLRAYFSGRRTRFDIEFTSAGTPFQQRVWQALEEIPYGTTLSYGALAERAGASRTAVRAVGTAIGRNPLLVVRPCHRVIGADGSLSGYAGGLERKRSLLRLEGIRDHA